MVDRAAITRMQPKVAALLDRAQTLHNAVLMLVHSHDITLVPEEIRMVLEGALDAHMIKQLEYVEWLLGMPERADAKLDYEMSNALRLDMQQWMDEGLDVLECWNWRVLKLARSGGHWDPPHSRPGLQVYNAALALHELFGFIDRCRT